jgi:hypothetical protein
MDQVHSLKARYLRIPRTIHQQEDNAILGINNAEDDFKAKFQNSYLQSFKSFYSFLGFMTERSICQEIAMPRVH